MIELPWSLNIRAIEWKQKSTNPFTFENFSPKSKISRKWIGKSKRECWCVFVLSELVWVGVWRHSEKSYLLLLLLLFICEQIGSSDQGIFMAIGFWGFRVFSALFFILMFRPFVTPTVTISIWANHSFIVLGCIKVHIPLSDLLLLAIIIR